MVIIAMLWIPVVQGAHSLYDYLQQVQGYLAPPIFVVFFFGVFWKRLNAKGCLYAMVVGFILGLFRMLVDTPVTMKLKGFEHGYTQGSFLWIVNNINFQYFSIIITLFSALVMVVVSYADPGARIRRRSRASPSAPPPMKTGPRRAPVGAGRKWRPPRSSCSASSAPTSTSGDRRKLGWAWWAPVPHMERAGRRPGRTPARVESGVGNYGKACTPRRALRPKCGRWPRRSWRSFPTRQRPGWPGRPLGRGAGLEGMARWLGIGHGRSVA